MIEWKPWMVELEFRVVHGSLFLDPTRRNVDPSRPTIADKKSDPTRPLIYYVSWVQHSSFFNVSRGWKKISSCLICQDRGLEATKWLQISDVREVFIFLFFLTIFRDSIQHNCHKMVSTLTLTKQIYQYLNEKRYEINKLENETITRAS